MFSSRLSLIALSALIATGCIYPRRSTSLTPVARADAGMISAPSDIWQLTIVGAEISPRKRGDLPWDEGGGAPDVFVRVYRGEALLFETPVEGDSHTPAWGATLPSNVHLPPGTALRFEVWDQDTVGNDPVGQFRSRGLPQNAIPDADARLLLEGGSYVTIRVSAPRPHRGVGIEQYEVRPDALVVMRVATHSPASRARLVPGDAILAIGDRQVSAMTDAEAASALSMASQRQSALTVRGANGREREVQLDRDFLWQTM
jgi:hypothetical protein